MLRLFLILFAASAALAAEPTSAPLANEPLAGGAIRYAPPPGWELASKGDDGLTATYKFLDLGTMIIAITPEEAQIQPEMKEQMAMQIGKGIRDMAKQQGNELLMPPRVEKDDRFFLKIHDQIRGEHGRIADRVQMYRMMGVYLVNVAVTAFVEKPEESKLVHTAGEDLLATMRSARGVHPSPFKRVGVRITPPLDWTERKFDQPNGPVATYIDPKVATREITVRCKVLPKIARDDAGKRDALLDKMIDEERRLPPLAPRSKNPVAEQQESDPAFIRKLKSSVEKDKNVLAVQTRYLQVGDVIISVRSVTLDGDADLGPIADKLAAGIKPMD